MLRVNRACGALRGRHVGATFAVFHIIWACGWYVGIDHDKPNRICQAHVLRAQTLSSPGCVSSLCPSHSRPSVRVGGACRHVWSVSARGREPKRLVLRWSQPDTDGVAHHRRRFAVKAVGIWEPWFYWRRAIRPQHMAVVKTRKLGLQSSAQR